MDIKRCVTMMRMHELGMSYKEIGYRFSISGERARQIIQKAKRLSIQEQVEQFDVVLNADAIRELTTLIDLLKTLSTYGAENENETVDPRSRSLQ